MENKCPNCGKEMKVIVEGSAKNFKCEYCGYSYATTIAEGIEWDANDYSIILEKNSNVSLSQIKTVSSVSAFNFIESKKLLLDGGPLTTARATIIKRKIDKLNNEGIKFKVTPEFKYWYINVGFSSGKFITFHYSKEPFKNG